MRQLTRVEEAAGGVGLLRSGHDKRRALAAGRWVSRSRHRVFWAAVLRIESRLAMGSSFWLWMASDGL
ncbi:hypothetical protein GUJ93_ZPchr0011g27193 [Zizania palustris]|uniref:Uncharacterized protein n=1 Tax=Zizania palustris TaxID=103762 RepID=A0A8J5WGG5_ZIZPA|nr:hypothetical protein GUJ93_ZPchr0011g27193 [Zizania palustris]